MSTREDWVMAKVARFALMAECLALLSGMPENTCSLMV